MAVTRVQQSVSSPTVKAPRRDTSLSIRLPEMFVLFLSGEPTVNRHYKCVKELSEAWISRQNDILSYCKEEVAFNHVGEMLIERYRDWYLALAALPTWGERIDADVQEYIRGVQNVVRANLHWSFRSGRYFGKANDQVRKTGIVTVRSNNADFKLSMA
ncbi:terpene synthase metal binding domain protein [Aspergillus luchuensis]|uniref:Terpene synthase metal binding domain protein n=1 Tax=Aspergillus kawachii TaxID=1069201 RepID=A0A146FVM4_ASPKA|nr:terpene synthase metal binding domain protein [Aspergillus luchuensis]